MKKLIAHARELLELVRSIPAEIMLGIEARKELELLRHDLYALGFDSIPDLGMAWHEAEQRWGRALHEQERAEGAHAALLADVVRTRARLFEALGGREEDGIPTLPSLLDVSTARLEKLRHLEGRQAVEEELGPERRPGPRWDFVARAIPTLDQIVKSDPLYVSRTDRIGARIRDQYDALGLQVTDEQTLYVSLVAVGMIVELASDGIENGNVSPTTLRNLAAVTQTFAASLIPYLPEEAFGS